MTKGVLYNTGAVALNEKFLLGRFTKLNLIILLLLASLSLVGCQSPVTYAPGRTTADLPHQKSTIVFSGVTEGSMTGDKSIPNSSPDQLRINDIVRDELVSYLNKQSISVVSDREKCSDCISIKTLVYFLPWNPITGGHVNVFIDSYDLQDRKIFTAFYGRDFVLISMAFDGGTDEIVRASTDRAAERFIKELRGEK